MIDLDIKIPTRKQHCKQLMLDIFGPKCAARVDEMTEAECVEKCKEKVRSLLGDDAVRRLEYLEDTRQSE